MTTSSMNRFVAFYASDYQTHKVDKAIRSLRGLPVGWHYGEGVPATEAAVSAALAARLKLLELGFNRIEAFPRTDGSVVVSGIDASDVVDVVCRDPSDYDVYLERDDEEILDEDHLSLPEVLARIRLLGWKEMSHYDYFTRGTTRMSVDASTVQHVRRQTTGFQSLTKYALSEAMAQNADTYHFIMRNASPEAPPYSYGSLYQNSLPTASFRTRLPPETNAIS